MQIRIMRIFFSSLFLFIVSISIQGKISLNGEWQASRISRQEFIDATVLNLQNLERLKISLPGRYHKFFKSNFNYVLLEKKFYFNNIPQSDLALFLGEIKSIDKTFVNGFLVGKSGKLSPSLNQAFDKKRFYHISSHILKNINTIQIFTHEPQPQNRGGIKAKEIYLGHYEKLLQDQTRNYVFQFFLVSSLFLIALYFLTIFRNYSTKKDILYLGMMSLCLAAYLFFYSNIKYLFFSNLSILKPVEYTFLFLLPIIYFLFTNSITPIRSKLLKNILLLVLSLFIPLGWLLPHFYQLFLLLKIWQPVMLFIVIYCFVKHLQYWDLKSLEGKFFLASYSTLVLAITSDVLRTQDVHNLPKTLPLAVFFLLLITALAIGNRLGKVHQAIQFHYRNLIDLATKVSSNKSYAILLNDAYNFLTHNMRASLVSVNIQSYTGQVFEKLSSSHLSNIPIWFHQNNLPTNTLIHDYKNLSLLKEKFPISSDDKHLAFVLFDIGDKKNQKGFYFCVFPYNKQKQDVIYVLQILQKQLLAEIDKLDFQLNLQTVNESLEQTISLRTLQLRKKNESLIQLNQENTQFYSNFTHDIRTPLSLITIPIEMLLQNAKNLDEQQVNLLTRIKHNAFRIIENINNLLDSARKKTNNLNFYPTLCDINSFLKKYCNIFYDTLAHKNMKLVLNLPDEKVTAEVDEEKLEKMLNNLMSNAIKYNRENHPIEITLKTIDSKFLISVRDHGTGLTTNEMTNLGKPFNQNIDLMGKSRVGTGLGLSIINDFIKLHKGKLLIKSEKNIFCEFTLQLPLSMNHSLVVKKSMFNSDLPLAWQLKDKVSSNITSQNLTSESDYTFPLVTLAGFLSSKSKVKLKRYFDIIEISQDSELEHILRKHQYFIGIFEIDNENINKWQKNKIFKKIASYYMPYLCILPEASQKMQESNGFYFRRPVVFAEILNKLMILSQQKELRLQLLRLTAKGITP